MTESDLYGSSFDYDGNSPCVYFRPMNPALSVHNRFPDDSPLYMYDKDSWNKRGGIAWTPASPVMGSTSYMSQESSYCSLLNNAVIMEDDEVETIPSDEKPLPSASQRLMEGNSSLQDDVSPIVLNSHRQLNKAADIETDRPAVLSTTNDSSSGVIDSFPNTFSTEGRDSSLQEFLNIPQNLNGVAIPTEQDDRIISVIPPVGDYGYPASSPGPQWSPGIRNGSKFVNTSISAMRTPDETQGIIHVEATLNYLDGIPSTSPASRRRREDDSSMSISAIPVTRNDDVTNLEDCPQSSDVVLENSTQLMSETVLIEPVDEPQPIMGHEPSPVKKFTHRRTLSIFGSSTSSTALPPGLPVHANPSPRIQRSPSPKPSHVSSILGPLSARSGLSSIEREVKEAEEGRRKLLDQIRMNRRNFETLKSSTNPITTFSNSRFYSPGGPLPPAPRVPSKFFVPSTMSSVTRSARMSRGRSGVPPPPSTSFFLDKTTTISPLSLSRHITPPTTITSQATRRTLSSAQRSLNTTSINVTRVSVPKLNTSRSRSMSVSAPRVPSSGSACRSSSQRPPWRF
jgi:hypothetical protein